MSGHLRARSDIRTVRRPAGPRPSIHVWQDGRAMDPSTETATQALHRITSYGRYDAPDPDLVVNDPDRLPWSYKRYPDALPTVLLPRDLPPPSAPAVAVLAGTAAIAPGTLDLPQLARVLHLAAGIVRTMVRPYATWLFRNAGSAGGRV